MRFIPAANFTKLDGPRRVIDLVCLHSMESPEAAGTATNVATWFGGTTAPQASAHFCVDADSIIQCVRLQDVAWAAPGANAQGVHIELAGRAAQTPAEWADAFSTAMLDLAAHLVAELCRTLNVPPVFIDATNLKLGNRGITTHAEVSAAWKRSSHWDPGPGFPLAAFIEKVNVRLRQLQAAGPFS